MKKQIIILVGLLTYCNARSQDFIKITTPCTEEFLQNVPGRWLKLGSSLNANISKPQQQEILNRLVKIHQLVFNTYPSPAGVDVGYTQHTTDEQFAYQVKLDHLANGNTHESWINGIPVVVYWYEAYFGKYSCGRDKYEMFPGLPNEDVELLWVYANSFSFFGSGGGLHEMNIDGREIRMMPIVKGQWKGYTLYTHETGSGKTMVLLHRDGMLPYTSVTRKQYLDLSISYLDKMFDKMISDIDENVKAFVDAGMADTQTIKKNKAIYANQKKQVLKYYNDELAATTAAGLLDAPAILHAYATLCDVDTKVPIFSTEAEGGKLLVIDNPAYFRKDLPKYVPQFFVLTFEGASWSRKQKNDPLKIVYENFPIGELQAMIDK